MENIMKNTVKYVGSPIQQFYHNKTIFLTGGTGFLGKVTMEKLLRACDVRHIIIMIRSKKGKEIQTRLDEMLTDPLFDCLKKEKPEFRNKIKTVTGDCSLQGLGLNSNDRALVVREANVVFHLAAIVKFDEAFRVAMQTNVYGTKDVVELCSEIEQLDSFVYVSTAYSNCNRLNVDEKFYKSRLGVEKICQLTECLDDKMLNLLVPEIMNGWPNTYTYTKSLAENYVRENSGRMPVGVFRPSIVMPTARDPISGWVDNIYGPSGYTFGIALGFLRVFMTDVKMPTELVPVDFCVNSLLATGWEVGTNKFLDPPIYNYVTDATNPITFGDYIHLSFKHGRNIPVSKSLWYNTLTTTTSTLKYEVLKFFYHIVPGALMDLARLFSGKKLKFLKIYEKVHKFSYSMAFFSINKWNFTNKNVRNLWEKMTPEDKNRFWFDMKSLDWDNYMKDSLYGMRTYLVKDDPSTLPYARERMKKLKVLHYSVVYGVLSIFWTIVAYMLARFFGIL